MQIIDPGLSNILQIIDPGLSNILQIIDPELSDILKNKDPGYLIFCNRWSVGCLQIHTNPGLYVCSSQILELG